MIYSKIIDKFNLEGNDIMIRYLGRNDLAKLLQLINSLVNEKAMIGIQKKQTKDKFKKRFLEALRDIKDKVTVDLVIETNNKIEGRAWIKKYRGPLQSHVGELGIYLSKHIRGKGIGDRLFKQVIKEAKKKLKLKIVTLGTMVTNKAALNLYKSNGFKKVGIVKGGVKYYDKYIDDITMVKYLR